MPQLPEYIPDNLSPAGSQAIELAVCCAAVEKLLVVTHFAQYLVLNIPIYQPTQLITVIHDLNAMIKFYRQIFHFLYFYNYHHINPPILTNQRERVFQILLGITD